MEIVFSLANSTRLADWGGILAAGIVDLPIGWYLLVYPGLTMAVLSFIIGFWLLFKGFSALSMAFEAKQYGGTGWLWLLFFSLAMISFAGLILANPAFGISNIISWTASANLVADLFRVYSVIRLVKLGRHLVD